MASPLSIGITASIIAVVNKKRDIIRFQNTSAAAIVYIKKIPLTGTTTTVSATDYDVMLTGNTVEGGEVFETNSIASFMAIASVAATPLSVYETSKV